MLIYVNQLYKVKNKLLGINYILFIEIHYIALYKCD